MKKCLFLALFLIAASSDILIAQDVESLPADPRITKGQLANGLTYYLFKNVGTPKKADFMIAQKFGENIENEGQAGMLKMLELLALRGTRNFPDSTITTYLNGLGLAQKDIQFETNANNSIYAIRNVPLKNSNVTDSTLLILYNWMSSINIDEEDVESAAILYGNKIRNYWTAEKRLNFMGEQAFLSSDCRAKNQKPWESIPKFTSKELRNFYYKSFRPDQQAIIISGDIDPESLKTRITSLFSTIPKAPAAKAEAVKYSSDTTDFISVQKDKEYNKAFVSIDFIKQDLPDKYKNTSVPFIQEFMTESILNLLSARINDGVLRNNLPVWNVVCGVKRMEYVTGKNLVSVSFETLPDNIYTTLNFLSQEIDRMAIFGFNGQELIKSKDLYYDKIKMLYETRFEQPNQLFTDMMVNNYFYGNTLGSIELKFEIMKEIVYSITSKQLNDYAKALLGDKEHIRIMCNVPDRKSVENISKDRLYTTFKEALATNGPDNTGYEAILWPEIPCREPNLTKVQESTDPLTGAIEYHLANGATIVFKQTTDSKDTISVKAVSKGGFSMMDGITLSNARYMNEIVNMGGWANVRQTEVKRLYTYNNMDVTSKILLNKEEVLGYAPKSNVENLFKAIYLNFAQRRKDDAAFEMYQKSKVLESEYDMFSPERMFHDTVTYYNNSNKRYVGRVTTQDIMNLNYDKMFDQIKKRYSNAADFIFIVSGNIDAAVVKELSAKYIGMLSGNSNTRESGYVVPNYLTKGKVDREFLAEMVLPRCYLNITNSLGVEYNVRNYIMAKLCSAYLKTQIENSPIKDITTDVAVNSYILNYPENIFVLNSEFVSDSSQIYKLKELYSGILQNIAADGVNEEYFKSSVKYVKAVFNSIKNTNFYWQNVLEERYMNNLNFNQEFVKKLEEISLAEFSDFVKSLIKTGNSVLVLMEGTTDDVKTQNLFREDDFVKDFFNVK